MSHPVSLQENPIPFFALLLTVPLTSVDHVAVSETRGDYHL